MKHLGAALLCLALAACGDVPDDPPAGQIESLRGQWVVINYWAEWCGPCIKEIPELNKLHRERKDLTVLGVNYDGAEGEDLSRQVNELGIDFPMLADDPAASLGTSRPMVLPTTLVLDPSGALTQTLVGPQTHQSLSSATLRNNVGE